MTFSLHYFCNISEQRLKNRVTVADRPTVVDHEDSVAEFNESNGSMLEAWVSFHQRSTNSF